MNKIVSDYVAKLATDQLVDILIAHQDFRRHGAACHTTTLAVIDNYTKLFNEFYYSEFSTAHYNFIESQQKLFESLAHATAAAYFDKTQRRVHD